LPPLQGFRGSVNHAIINTTGLARYQSLDQPTAEVLVSAQFIPQQPATDNQHPTFLF
jgi:hypothetical protein